MVLVPKMRAPRWRNFEMRLQQQNGRQLALMTIRFEQ